jgi:phosphatidylglycerophosphate synthase
MKISIKDIKDSLPNEKVKSDPIWTNVFLRPISIPVSWFFIKIGFSANNVTYLSIVVSLIGGVLIMSKSLYLAIIGAVLFNFFAILDCVDGNIARVSSTKSIYGGWVDALGGYFTYTFVLIFSGLALNDSQFNYPFDLDYLFIACIAAIANLLMRVIYQNFKSVDNSIVSEKLSKKRSLTQNFGITGIMMPFLLISIIYDFLNIFILFYALYFILLCLGVIFKLVSKVRNYKA